MKIKSVIVKARAEVPNLKPGDRIELETSDFATLYDEGVVVTASEYAADQRLQGTVKAETTKREAAVDAEVKAAIGRKVFAPGADTSAIRADALAMETVKAGSGIAYIKAQQPDAALSHLTQRETQSDDPTKGASSVEVGTPALRDTVVAYLKASEVFSNKRPDGGIVRAKKGDEIEMKGVVAHARKRSQYMSAIVDAIHGGANFSAEAIIKAADYADPNAGNPVGVLNTGLLVAQNLGFLKNQLRMLKDITTDLSNQPAEFNQVVRSRYVIVPGVQLKTDGTPWRFVEGNTKDVNVTMSTYAGVAIGFGNALISSTVRQLFAEQRTPMLYGLGEYILNHLVSTALNGSNRIANDGTTVANIKFNPAGAGFTNGIFTPVNGKWDLAAMTAGLPQAMDLAKFPGGDEGENDPLLRYAWLHTNIYAGIAGNTDLLLNQSIQSIARKSGDNTLLTGRINRLGNVSLTKSQLVSDTNTLSSDGGNPAINTVVPGVPNVIGGLCGTRSSLLFVSRPPTDYTKVLPDVPATASIEMVTEDEIGLTLTITKHLDHGYENAYMRVATMFGNAVGDERQGGWLHI